VKSGSYEETILNKLYNGEASLSELELFNDYVGRMADFALILNNTEALKYWSMVSKVFTELLIDDTRRKFFTNT